MHVLWRNHFVDVLRWVILLWIEILSEGIEITNNLRGVVSVEILKLNEWEWTLETIFY